MPLIPIENITKVPTILYVGKEDKWSTIEDAEWLESEVPSIVRTYLVEGFDHQEFRKVNLTKKGKEAMQYQENIYKDLQFHNPLDGHETARHSMLYELVPKNYGKKVEMLDMKRETSSWNFSLSHLLIMASFLVLAAAILFSVILWRCVASWKGRHTK